MKRVAVLISILVLALAGAGNVRAQEEKPFDLKELNKFIVDFPAIADDLKKIGHTFDAQNDGQEWQNPATAKFFEKQLQKRGWQSGRFVYILSHIGSGLAAISMADVAPVLKQQISEAGKAIMDNPALSDEMKARLMSQMQDGLGASAQLSDALDALPAQEIGLIKQNKEKLMEILDR